MDIYINKLGSALKKEKEHFLILSKDKEKQLLSPDLIDAFIISDNCVISSNAIKLAIKTNIPMYLVNEYGDVYGKIWNTFNTKTSIQLKQLKIFNSQYGNIIGREWIIKKIDSQKKHLIKLLKRKKEAFIEIEEEFNKLIENIKKINPENQRYSNVIMGYEGVASNLYYSNINSLLAPEWKFEKRNNYKAKEPYNIILNYLFGILYYKVENALTVAGLNIYIGIFHSNSLKQKSLLFDFIEPYRVYAWETTFSLFSKKLINKNFFDEKTKLLTQEGKKIIISEFYKKLNSIKSIKDKNIKFEFMLLNEARELVKDLEKNELYNKL